MGVDYSTTVGFGIAIDDRDLPQVLKDIAEYVDEEHIIPWLKENGFTRIDYDKIGNWMSGPTYIFFHLPRTLIHGGLYEMEGVHYFDNIEMYPEEEQQFRRLTELLGGTEIDGPRWLVSFNVS